MVLGVGVFIYLFNLCYRAISKRVGVGVGGCKCFLLDIRNERDVESESGCVRGFERGP